MTVKKPPTPKPKAPPEPEVEVEVEVDPVFSWRVERLQREGFPRFVAFRLAMSGGDYRKMVRMRKRGATDDQILNEFTD